LSQLYSAFDPLATPLAFSINSSIEVALGTTPLYNEQVREISPSPRQLNHMGQMTDLLRASLRDLAQSDARRLREIDRILKESRLVDKKLKGG